MNSSASLGRLSFSSVLGRSLQLFRKHPSLVVFPLLTTTASAGMFFSMVRGSDFPLQFGWWNPSSTLVSLVWGDFHVGYFALFYFVTVFAATFFNVGLYHEVMRAFSGEEPSLAGGLRFALSRIASIATWSLFAWSVGVIIHLAGARFGWASRIVGDFAKFAWSVASVFAILVLVREGDLNPTRVLRNSSAMVRRTWRGLVYGFAGLVPVILLFIIFTSLAVAGAKSSLQLSPARGVEIATILSIGYLVALVTVKDIYRCALYIYATEGVVPASFLPADMDVGWKIRGGSATDALSSLPGEETPISPRSGHQVGRILQWAMAGLATVAMLAVAGLFSLGIYVFHRLGNLPVSQGAISRVASAPAVTAVLGSPIKAGFIFSGSFSPHDAPPHAEFNFPISAPHGTAAVEVRATKADGIWHYEQMVVRPSDGGAPIDISEQSISAASAPR
jgi:Family of unknown function (DUF6159)/Cytochrome oxidase complex assembly protein 1